MEDNDLKSVVSIGNKATNFITNVRLSSVDNDDQSEGRWFDAIVLKSKFTVEWIVLVVPGKELVGVWTIVWLAWLEDANKFPEYCDSQRKTESLLGDNGKLGVTGEETIELDPLPIIASESVDLADLKLDVDELLDVTDLKDWRRFLI